MGLTSLLNQDLNHQEIKSRIITIIQCLVNQLNFFMHAQTQSGEEGKKRKYSNDIYQEDDDSSDDLGGFQYEENMEDMTSSEVSIQLTARLIFSTKR